MKKIVFYAVSGKFTFDAFRAFAGIVLHNEALLNSGNIRIVIITAVCKIKEVFYRDRGNRCVKRKAYRAVIFENDFHVMEAVVFRIDGYVGFEGLCFHFFAA